MGGNVWQLETAVTKIAASGAAQTLTYPPYGPCAYDITLTANCALTITGGVPGQRQVMSIMLRQDATGGRTTTISPAVTWSNNAPLAFATGANGVTEISLTTTDGGVTLIAK